MSDSSTQPVISTDGLSCSGLWKVFRQGRQIVRAIQNVSLNIEPGELVCITGDSGSGKSTLLALLATLENPTKGKIRAFGTKYEDMNENDKDQFRRDRVGFVSQSFQLIPHLTALENVLLPDLFGQTKIAVLRATAEVWLGRLNLSDRLGHFPHELSYGEQQRVAFARALLRHPLLLFADEPSANLDDSNVKRLVAILNEFRSKETLTVVASHDPRLIAVADRQLHLNRGILEPNQSF